MLCAQHCGRPLGDKGEVDEMEALALKRLATIGELCVWNSMVSVVCLFSVIDTYGRKRSQWYGKRFCEERERELDFENVGEESGCSRQGNWRGQRREYGGDGI